MKLRKDHKERVRTAFTVLQHYQEQVRIQHAALAAFLLTAYGVDIEHEQWDIDFAKGTLTPLTSDVVPE